MDPYLIMGIVGLILSLVLVLILGKRQFEPARLTLVFYLFAVVGMLIGGHLLYFIVNLPSFIENTAPNIHSFSDFIVEFYYAASGLVFYGGILGALLCMYIFAKSSSLWPRHQLNIMVPGCMIFHICGRIGCVLTGCCYGIEYHGIGAITYHASQITPGINDELADFTRFPIQLLEAGLELILLIIILILYIKKSDRISCTVIYLTSYSVIRFFDEFLRGDAVRGIWGPFSTSQWISIVIFIAMILYIIKLKKDEKAYFQSQK